jgi:hypothetical protein
VIDCWLPSFTLIARLSERWNNPQHDPGAPEDVYCPAGAALRQAPHVILTAKTSWNIPAIALPSTSSLPSQLLVRPSHSVMICCS